MVSILSLLCNIYNSVHLNEWFLNLTVTNTLHGNNRHHKPLKGHYQIPDLKWCFLFLDIPYTSIHGTEVKVIDLI